MTKCFCCNKSLNIAVMGDDPTILSPLYRGLWFRAYGNYGSGVFDPVDDGFLQVAICDDCIKVKIKRVRRIYNIQKTADVKPFEIEE